MPKTLKFNSQLQALIWSDPPVTVPFEKSSRLEKPGRTDRRAVQIMKRLGRQICLAHGYIAFRSAMNKHLLTPEEKARYGSAQDSKPKSKKYVRRVLDI